MRIALALLALFIATACGSTDSATADEVGLLAICLLKLSALISDLYETLHIVEQMIKPRKVSEALRVT